MVIHPAEDRLQVEIVGEIVKMVELGLDAKQAALPEETACSVKVVAGGLQHLLFAAVRDTADWVNLSLTRGQDSNFVHFSWRRVWRDWGGFSLERHGIEAADVLRNPSPSILYQAALRENRGSAIATSGALIAYSGAKTGRSPAAKRLVKDVDSAPNIWWGDVNIKIDDENFAINRERAIDYFNSCDTLYCIDGAVCWDPRHRFKVRVICARPYTPCSCTTC